jgi:hypothetical protein
MMLSTAKVTAIAATAIAISIATGVAGRGCQLLLPQSLLIVVVALFHHAPPVVLVLQQMLLMFAACCCNPRFVTCRWLQS